MKKILAFFLSVILSFSAIYGGQVFGSTQSDNSHSYIENIDSEIVY